MIHVHTLAHRPYMIHTLAHTHTESEVLIKDTSIKNEECHTLINAVTIISSFKCVNNNKQRTC